MIRRSPAVPDNIFALEPHRNFGDYARTYGDELSRRYEDLNILFFPVFPLDMDMDFLRSLTFPPHLKKIGTANGIERKLFERTGNTIAFSTTHILSQIFPSPSPLGYLQEQMVSVNWQIRVALRTLFPHYYSLRDANITWRMTETVNEGMHFDEYRNGTPIPAQEKLRHRVKLFVNIDSEPRKWRTTFTTPEVLKQCRDKLPAALPDDLGLLNYRLNRGPLRDLPYHEIDIPPLGAVMGDAEVIGHQVRYGRRMIAAECLCATSDMLDPAKASHARLGGWLKDAGIGIDPIAAPLDIPVPASSGYQGEA